MANNYVFFQGSRENGKLMESVWQNTPTQVINVSMSNSPCVVKYNETLYTFYEGSAQDGKLRYNSSEDGSTWGQQKTVPDASISSSPTAVVFDGILYVFHQGGGNDGNLYYCTFDGKTWNGDTQITGCSISDSPSAVVYNTTADAKNDVLYVFFQGSRNSGSLYYASLAVGGEWPSSASQISGAAMSFSPGAVVTDYGKATARIAVFYQGQGQNGTLWFNTYANATWTNGQQYLGVSMSASPCPAVFQDGNLYVLYQAGGQAGKLNYFNFTNSSSPIGTAIDMSQSPAAIVF